MSHQFPGFFNGWNILGSMFEGTSVFMKREPHLYWNTKHTTKFLVESMAQLWPIWTHVLPDNALSQLKGQEGPRSIKKKKQTGSSHSVLIRMESAELPEHQPSCSSKTKGSRCSLSCFLAIEMQTGAYFWATTFKVAKTQNSRYAILISPFPLIHLAQVQCSDQVSSTAKDELALCL